MTKTQALAELLATLLGYAALIWWIFTRAKKD